MGCFNKSCKITGLQMTHGDPIVGIRLVESKHKDFDLIHSTWYPIEFPVRGFYDDYGRIEDKDGKLLYGDEDNDYDCTRCYDMFLMHEWAYEFVLKHAEKRRKEYAKHGYTDWAAKDRKELEGCFKGYEDFKKQDDDSYKSCIFISEMTIGSLIQSRINSYLPYDAVYFWRDELKADDYETTQANINRFKKEILTLENWRFELGFQWTPSYVANQEVDIEFNEGLLEKSKTYLDSLKKKWNYDE